MTSRRRPSRGRRLRALACRQWRRPPGAPPASGWGDRIVGVPLPCRIAGTAPGSVILLGISMRTRHGRVRHGHSRDERDREEEQGAEPAQPDQDLADDRGGYHDDQQMTEHQPQRHSDHFIRDRCTPSPPVRPGSKAPNSLVQHLDLPNARCRCCARDERLCRPDDPHRASGRCRCRRCHGRRNRCASRRSTHQTLPCR